MIDKMRKETLKNSTRKEGEDDKMKYEMKEGRNAGAEEGK